MHSQRTKREGVRCKFLLITGVFSICMLFHLKIHDFDYFETCAYYATYVFKVLEK